MDSFIEPLILYAVLFFRMSTGTVAAAMPAEEAVPFSVIVEIARIVYNIPSLALVWYLLLKSRGVHEWGAGLREWGVTLPGKKDIVPALMALPALVCIGLTIAVVSRHFDTAASGQRFLPPQTVITWSILVVSCLSTAYLEESFFRFYLLSKRSEMGLGPHRAVLVSTLLFSVCHMYEGPWGFLNAAFSGIVLAFVFLRFRSLHGIAFSHALYNILVYVLGSA